MGLLGWLLLAQSARASNDALVSAIEIPAPDLLAAQVVGLPVAHGVRSNLGMLRPRAGSSFAVLSTGPLGSMPQGGVDMGRPNEVDDEVVLILQLMPPPGATALQLDFFFLSAEYPEFVGSQYNDLFSAEVSGPAWSGDAARDHAGHPISINNVFFDVTDGPQLLGTGFGLGVGGGTGWLTASIPAQPGAPLSLTLRIRDVGDGAFDSVVLLDHFRWSGLALDDAGLARATDDGGGVSATSPFDTSGLPVDCVVGETCAGTVTTEQAGQIIVSAGGQPIGAGAGSATASTRPTETGELPLTIQLVGEDGAVVASITHTVSVSPPLELRLPPALDFGQVPAGAATLSDAACVSLGVEDTPALAAHTFKLDVAVPDGCLSRPALRFVSKGGWPSAVRLPTEGYSLAADQQLCLTVPYCAGEAIQGATLTVTPTDPRFASQQAQVDLRWEVTGKTWLACHGWWLAIIAATLFVLWVFVGLVRPARFSREVSVTVAGSQKGLRRAAPQLLRECPGARAGFYRDAALGVHADGSINGRARGSLIQLRARRRGGMIVSGAIEVIDRRTRKPSVPEDLAEGHVPTPGATYRAGDLWLRFEGL